MKVAANFYLQEFVSKSMYSKWGNKCIWFVDPRLFLLAQFYRDRFGGVTINNWLWGGKYNYSGFREPACKVGAKLSQHRFCKADDKKFDEVTVQEVYEDVIKNYDLYKKFGLTTIENIKATPTWLHGDLRNTMQDELLIVNP